MLVPGNDEVLKAFDSDIKPHVEEISEIDNGGLLLNITMDCVGVVTSKIMIENSRKYFLCGDHTTVLALDGERVIGCATMCYISIMPTFSHPTGKRAHLMNVYTMKEWQRRGIAKRMVFVLIEDAWKRGVTEISLDATEEGRSLYYKLGFTDSSECMVLVKP